MLFFLCIFFFNMLLTYVDVPPEYKLEIRTNIRSTARPPTPRAVQTGLLGECARHSISVINAGCHVRAWGVSKKDKYRGPIVLAFCFINCVARSCLTSSSSAAQPARACLLAVDFLKLMMC